MAKLTIIVSNNTVTHKVTTMFEARKLVNATSGVSKSFITFADGVVMEF